jgi:hypothetical protein
MAGRPNNAGAIAGKIQGLREAKAAFQALPEIVRDAMLAATETTVQMIANGAKARILASPSVQTRALYNHITWSVTKTNGRGRVGVASGTTTVSNLSTRTSVKVKGLIQSHVGKDGKTTHRIVQPSRYARMVEFGYRPHARRALHDSGHRIAGGALSAAVPRGGVGHRAQHGRDRHEEPVTIASLIVNVEANTVQLQKDVAKVQSSLDSVSSLASRVGTAIAGAFTVQAVIAFAHELGEFAGRMNDLSAETGIGVERLQALNYVAAGVGLTVEDITGAIEKMARKVAGGDQSAARALDILGLSFAELQAMSPDEAFIAIGQAVAKIPDPMQRIRIETDLFGKSGARMGRAFTEDMQKVIEAAEKSGAVIDKHLIERADAFDDAWHQATIRGKAYVASFVGFMLDAPRCRTTRWSQAARSLQETLMRRSSRRI